MNNTLDTHDYQLSIEQSVCEKLPLWEYSHPVTMVSSYNQLKPALLRLFKTKSVEEIFSDENKIRMIGMDLEWKPMSRGGPHHRTALLQLYSPNCPVIIRLNKLIDEADGIQHFKFPPLLENILSSELIQKVGLSIKYDVQRLSHDFGIICRGYYDIADLPIYPYCKPQGLSGLAALFLGIKISKKMQVSNWEAPRLSSQQIRYAAGDAYLSRELYIAMSSIGALPRAFPALTL